MKHTIILLTTTAFSLLILGCNSLPVAYEKPSEPTQIIPLDFNASQRPVNINRGKIAAQDAIAYTNWTWSEGGSRTEYQLAARALAASLNSRDLLNKEDQMRLSVMTLQTALLANDREALRTGIEHWENAYASLDRITYAGEVESYLIACRIAGHSSISDLKYRANMTITQTIKE